MVGKKRSFETAIPEGGDSLPGSSTESPVPSTFQTEEELKIEDGSKKQVKAKTLQQSSKSSKKRTWKSLKQIIAHEKSQPLPEGCIHYSDIEAPPSLKPAKKYSDMLGLEAKYTDPQTKLRYATVEEYQIIKSLPNDIVTGYLALRKANVQV